MAEEDISQLLSEQHEEIDAVATFKTIVRTALKGTPDIQALVREWPTLLSAEMQFRDLPGDALALLRALKDSSGYVPSAEELKAAGVEVEKVRRKIDFDLMMQAAAHKAASAGLISPHPARGLELMHTTEAGGSVQDMGGSGGAADITVEAGRTNLAANSTRPFPNTPLAGSFPSQTGTGDLGSTFSPEQSGSGGDAQSTEQARQMRETQAMLHMISQQQVIFSQQQQALLNLVQSQGLKLQELENRGSAPISAQAGESFSELPRRGGEGGGGHPSDFSAVGGELIEGNTAPQAPVEDEPSQFDNSTPASQIGVIHCTPKEDLTKAK